MNLDFLRRTPQIHPTAYVHPSAVIMGDVRIGEGVTILPHVTLRGDINFIEIGAWSNVQDNSVIHLSDDHPVIIGEWVTIGHSAVIHACRIESRALVGMHATVLDGAVVGESSIVGANALVSGGSQIPPRSLVLGVPAKVVRPVSDEQLLTTRHYAEKYVKLGQELATMRKEGHSGL